MLVAMWEVLLGLAPWLLLGMAIAGLLHVALPANFVRRQLQGRSGVLRAVALGVPLPLCSCGVIPAGLGLKKDGASDGAAVALAVTCPLRISFHSPIRMAPWKGLALSKTHSCGEGDPSASAGHMSSPSSGSFDSELSPASRSNVGYKSTT